MMDKYVFVKRGLTIIELDDAFFRWCTKPEYYDAVIKLTSAEETCLTDVVLRRFPLLPINSR